MESLRQVASRSISTHTLARRVTYCGALPIKRMRISTHTLARRVTTGAQSQGYDPEYFNPHPRTEGDQRAAGDHVPGHRISTHTLARRVT